LSFFATLRARRVFAVGFIQKGTGDVDVFDFHRREESGVDEQTEALAQAVIGAAIEVHRHMGPGVTEIAYRNALCHEFDLRGIPYEYEVPVDIVYKGKVVGQARMDLVVGRAAIVELKAVDRLNDLHRAQVLTYLQLTKLKLGLLINFNVTLHKDGIKRVIYSY
jgi:GxxExxY protein